MKKPLIILSFLLAPFYSQAAQNVTLAHETNWVPHYGKSLPEGGYTVGIVNAAMKSAGYSLDAKWMPWKRAIEFAQNGKFDGLGASYCSAERQEVFVCSDVIANDDVVFYTLANSDITFNSMEDLKGYKIGVGKGYSYPDAFEKADYLDKRPATDLKQNIRKLSSGRVDIIIGSKQSILHNLNSNVIDDKSVIKQLGKPISTRSLHVLFSKASADYEGKNAAFNKGLKTIRENGEYNNIMSRFGLN